MFARVLPTLDDISHPVANAPSPMAVVNERLAIRYSRRVGVAGSVEPLLLVVGLLFDPPDAFIVAQVARGNARLWPDLGNFQRVVDAFCCNLTNQRGRTCFVNTRLQCLTG